MPGHMGPLGEAPGEVRRQKKEASVKAFTGVSMVKGRPGLRIS